MLRFRLLWITAVGIALIGADAVAQVAVNNGGPIGPAFAAGGGRGGGDGGSSFRAARQRPGSADESRRLAREAMLARREIERAFIELRREFLNSAEYRNAMLDVMHASAACRSAREIALAPLHQTDRFRSIQLQITTLEARLEELHVQADLSSDQVHQLAAALLAQRGDLSKLQAETLETDENYQTARYALIDAQARLSVLWDDFHESVRFDPRAQAARERLRSVREHLTGH